MIASIAGAIVNTRVAKTQFNANGLSVNRQRWVETMRDLVTGLNSQLLAAAAVRQIVEEPIGTVIAQDCELLRRVENLLRTMSKIELMLNPLERDHQKLNALMKSGRTASIPLARERHRGPHRGHRPRYHPGLARDPQTGVRPWEWTA